MTNAGDATNEVIGLMNAEKEEETQETEETEETETDTKEEDIHQVKILMMTDEKEEEDPTLMRIETEEAENLEDIPQVQRNESQVAAEMTQETKRDMIHETESSLQLEPQETTPLRAEDLITQMKEESDPHLLELHNTTLKIKDLRLI